MPGWNMCSNLSIICVHDFGMSTYVHSIYNYIMMLWCGIPCLWCSFISQRGARSCYDVEFLARGARPIIMWNSLLVVLVHATMWNSLLVVLVRATMWNSLLVVLAHTITWNSLLVVLVHATLWNSLLVNSWCSFILRMRNSLLVVLVHSIT